MEKLQAQWDAAWRELGAKPPAGVFAALVEHLTEPRRAYHNWRHVAECLAHLDSARHCCQRPAEVALALWFHDAVYDPKRDDNEALSADWAYRTLRQAGLPAEVAGRVCGLVLATQHDALPETADARVAVDIDLAILGAAPSRFDEYASQIRQEYAWVAEADFRNGRAEVLKGFLRRQRIYATDFFHRRLETRARTNLAKALSALSCASRADGAETEVSAPPSVGPS